MKNVSGQVVQSVWKDCVVFRLGHPSLTFGQPSAALLLYEQNWCLHSSTVSCARLLEGLWILPFVLSTLVVERPLASFWGDSQNYWSGAVFETCSMHGSKQDWTVKKVSGKKGCWPTYWWMLVNINAETLDSLMFVWFSCVSPGQVRLVLCLRSWLLPSSSSFFFSDCVWYSAGQWQHLDNDDDSVGCWCHYYRCTWRVPETVAHIL